MNERRVIPLGDIRDSDGTSAGAKALSLARMKRLGLPIPSGFCIAGTVYRDHLEATGLATTLKSAIENLALATIEEKRRLLSLLQQSIVETPLPESLGAEIGNHYKQLVAAQVAVRSSATAEDLPGHSFAGQYDTYLGIGNLPECLAAVKKCWASLWTQRAYDYRKQNGFDHLGADMAVIVQELVPADAAGVIFTADPVSGRLDRIVIEACSGMGEALVSGKVTPDRFVLVKADLSIISHSAPGSQCIDEAIARRLSELAKKAESAFGSPQDIEWALAGNAIFFLQSRPITTLHGPLSKKSMDSHFRGNDKSGVKTIRPREDRQIWSNLNTGEVMPDVVTPISWSVISRIVPIIFNSILGGIGLDTGNNPLIRQFGGRVYFNLNTMVAILRCLPGLGKKDITQVFGGDQGRLAEGGLIDLGEEHIPKLDFSFLRLMTRMPGFMFRIAVFPWKRADRLIAKIERESNDLKKFEIHSVSQQQLLERVRTAMEDISYVATAVPFAGIGMCFFAILEKLCQKWLEDEHMVIANRLLIGMGGMQSAESGLQLWRLAAKAREHPEVEGIIRSRADWQVVSAGLENIAAGADFLLSWNEFMDRHGHHTRGELELGNARWSETPDYILAVVRGYLDRFVEADPVENHKRSAGQRKNLEAMCLKRLSNPLKRMVFRFCLERAQRGILLRENFKNVAVRYMASVRFVLLGLGEKLVSEGIMESRRDVFFLTMEEVEPVSLKTAHFDVKKVVATRWAEHQRNLTITPPKVIVGSFEPDTSTTDIPSASEEQTEMLTGVPVSPGVVVGRARVILKADTGEQVLPGEILVAPFTDPGWTPCFISAAAIVMDQGGLLSHGSIIAREYGIPAVVNVGPATKIIKTGQTVEVNGDRGTVRIVR